MAINNILGFCIFSESTKLCIESIIEYIQCEVKSQKWLACINPHSYVVSLSDPKFSKALVGADWLIPDGVGIVLASKLLGQSIKTRITGSDIFFETSARINDLLGVRVFFLGSTNETLAKICLNMSKDYPNVIVAGTFSPEFKSNFSESDLNHMINLINSLNVDVLWVGLTAPKQEKFLFENLHKIDVKFAAAIGAVFDFYAGNIKRSHKFFQICGLEWLPRLLQEPSRLWRRSFISAPIFLWHVLKQKFF